MSFFDMKYSKFNMMTHFWASKNTVLFALILFSSCQAQNDFKSDTELLTGAQQTELFVNKIKGKTIAVVANQTSVIRNASGGYTHLIDSLLSLDVKVIKAFAPEHGFRGKADAGEKVNNSVDSKTGLPIVSLYGKHKKPTSEDLSGIDMLVFDIQDVGVRFYTYISTLHYVMEACAEQNIPVIVLDRPNPNRHYIDGPVLDMEYSSFVGMHPVPVVYGLSIGEYALMINGENWLENGIECQLEVIPLKNVDSNTIYELPVKPTPNLPNAKSINLYPSLCFFEGTTVNAGRGTDFQFQVFGSPYLDSTYFHFKYIPQPNEGSKYPKHSGKTCFGRDLTNQELLNGLDLKWLIEAYNNTELKNEFFNSFFAKLAGNEVLQQQIESGIPVEEIKASWQADLNSYLKMRKKYVLY